MHLTSSAIDWYAARAGGVVAYLLLSAGVVLGVTMARQRTFPLWPRFALEDVHRFIGLLVGAFLVLHVGTIAVDSYLPFSPVQLSIPFLSAYRPIWTGLGIVAAELLLALAITNHYRKRMQYRYWRRAHYLNFLVWGAATVHGLGSGTDRSAPWLVAIYVVCTAAVAASVAARFAPGRSYAAGAALGVAALVVAAALGPLRFQPKPWNAVAFQDSLSGQVVQQLGVTRGIVSMVGDGRGRQRVLVRADLLIEPQKLLTTAFQMELLPSGQLCRGTVTAVGRFGFDARCSTPDGRGRVVSARWDASQVPNVAGSITSSAA